MSNNNGQRVTRRRFIKTAGSMALAAGVGSSIIVPGRTSAQQKTLKILQWNHFVPGYDKWFNNTYVKEWGEKNNTKVTVDNIGLGHLILFVSTTAKPTESPTLPQLKGQPDQ